MIKKAKIRGRFSCNKTSFLVFLFTNRKKENQNPIFIDFDIYLEKIYPWILFHLSVMGLGRVNPSG